MPRRKSNLSRHTRVVKARRRFLANQTEEQRASTREKNRQRAAQMRAKETAERREARLQEARLRARQSRLASHLLRSQQRTNKLKNSYFLDRSDDRILQYQIGMIQNGLNNNLSRQNTSVSYAFKLADKMPKQTKSNLPQLHLLPLKREENLRTYSRKPKNRDTSVAATSEVTFSEKCIDLDYNTDVTCFPNFKDCSQDKIIQCTDIAVKLENNASDDCTPITKDEIVYEDHNEYKCFTATDCKSIKNVPSLQNEIIKKAEEIIELSCSRKYDDDTLNFVQEQLNQVLQVLKSAEQTTIDKIS